MPVSIKKGRPHMKSLRKKSSSPAQEGRLTDLEEKVARRGIQIHYDRLEAAGLKLKGGICKVRGEYHLFLDKRKSTVEKIDILEDCLSQPFPEDIPP
jgi:hypothetical protein